MSGLIPLSRLSDEELLGRLFITSQENKTPMEIELGIRLEHALDELAKRPKRAEDIADGYDAGI